MRYRWYLFQLLSEWICLILPLILDSVCFFSIDKGLLSGLGFFWLWITDARPFVFFYYYILWGFDIHISCTIAKELSCTHVWALSERAAHTRWENRTLLGSLRLSDVFFGFFNGENRSLLLLLVANFFRCERKHHLIQFIWVSRLSSSMIPFSHCLHLGMLGGRCLHILCLNLMNQLQLSGRQEKWAPASKA
jgi:hypothetical protein